MFYRLKNAWLVLTNKDLNVAVDIGGQMLIAAMHNRLITGSVTITKQDGSVNYAEYYLIPKEVNKHE